VKWPAKYQKSTYPTLSLSRCMLFEFHKSSNATVATKNICDVYPSVLNVRKCHQLSK